MLNTDPWLLPPTAENTQCPGNGGGHKQPTDMRPVGGVANTSITGAQESAMAFGRPPTLKNRSTLAPTSSRGTEGR